MFFVSLSTLLLGGVLLLGIILLIAVIMRR